MSDFFKEPAWIQDLLVFRNPDQYIEEINATLPVEVAEPVISVVIPVYNEGKTILRTLLSISRNKTKIPYEIVVVNNNSTDNTCEFLEKVRIKLVHETKAGSGPAREKGQITAKGKYILTGDGDCFYPPGWIERMYKEILKPDTSAGFSRHSFFSESEGRWKFSLYEIPVRFLAEYKNLKRPFLNCHTMSMIYPREKGVEIGFNTNNQRGEDGRMCFDLMSYGRVRYIRDSKAKVWTYPRTLLKDGSLTNAFRVRLKKELRKIPAYFFPLAPHDTKISKNDD